MRYAVPPYACSSPICLFDDGRKAGHTYSQPDLIIAAIALHHGLTVVSRDISDFNKARVPGSHLWRDADAG
jgi:predicted nucleic acid-binding protein